MVAKKTTRGRKDVNKSQEIRNYLKTHRNAKPKQIIADLGAKGVNVSAALVSSIKYAKNRGKKVKTIGRKARADRNSITAEDLIQAKGLADQLGGVERAKVALDTLKKLN